MSSSVTQSPTKNDTLAVFGGSKTLRYEMPTYSSYGDEEKAAAHRVLERGVLSQFIGAWCDDFYGGAEVRAFEAEWSQAFQVKHSVTVNSATSGLICALGALDLEPGDEVICSPWTMSADPAAILVWNAIPIFADIETETFNLDPRSIVKSISPRTKAILVSDIFGQAGKLDEIMTIARKHNLKVIEDAAQAPWAKYQGKFVGTIADIGVFSLNYHKHIHTGEGGICVTDDDALAERMQLIRNHGESVVAKKPVSSLHNLIGFNFRLGEIEAAMGREQLKKLPRLATDKTRAGLRLNQGLANLPHLKTPSVQQEATHVFYVYPLVLDTKGLGIPRGKICEALRAEGIPIVAEGYASLHLLPMFRDKVAYGRQQFPWSLTERGRQITYAKGLCPVTEELHQETLIRLGPCSHRFSDEDVDLVVEAFQKVWRNLAPLRTYA